MSGEMSDPFQWVTAVPGQRSREELLTARQETQGLDWWEGYLTSRRSISRQIKWLLEAIASSNSRLVTSVPGRRCDCSRQVWPAIASLSAAEPRTRAAAGWTQLSSAAWRAALPLGASVGWAWVVGERWLFERGRGPRFGDAFFFTIRSDGPYAARLRVPDNATSGVHGHTLGQQARRHAIIVLAWLNESGD